MTRMLVTGGAGFIGSHLVDALLDDGHEVVVLDLLTTGNLRNLDAAMDRITFVQGSILDEALVDDLVREADTVFHLAAAVGVRYIVQEPFESMITNVRGTENVLLACHRHGARVLLASTSEIYGDTPKLPMNEDDERVLGSTKVHRWSYSTSKALDEHMAFALQDKGLPVSVVRYCNAYGPRIDPAGYGSVVANFLRQAIAGEPITVHGDGQQSRCFTFVGDTVRGTIAAGTRDSALGEIVNLGTSDEITVLELAKLVRDYVGSDSPIEFQDYESYYGSGFADTRRRVPDNARARDLLDWVPTVELTEGIGLTYEWWKQTHGV